MTEPRCPRRLSFLLPAALLGLALACQARPMQREDEVVSDVRHGRFAQALAGARKLADEHPEDPRLQALLRDAEVAYILDQGRDEVFHGELTRALDYFEQAEHLAPDNATVSAWIAKTRYQLADRWLDVAASETGSDSLQRSEHAYEMVLKYDPDNADAKRGLAHALLLSNYRAGMSKTYFDDGLSNFRRLQLEQARRAFMASHRYQDNPPASQRRGQVEELMAEERLVQARNLEQEGLFFAARNEYRLVLLIDPENVEGRAGLDRMDRESRAVRSMSEAEMEIRRGSLDAAQETLAQAQVLSESQQDGITLLQSSIQERRFEDLYRQAASLTEDYRYPEAVAAYDELLELDPGYKDAALRRQTIQEFIQLVEEAYAKALDAESDDEAEDYLRRIPVLWPEYKDVAERLRAIETRKGGAARRPQEPEGDGGGSEADGG